MLRKRRLWLKRQYEVLKLAEKDEHLETKSEKLRTGDIFLNLGSAETQNKHHISIKQGKGKKGSKK